MGSGGRGLGDLAVQACRTARQFHPQSKFACASGTMISGTSKHSEPSKSAQFGSWGDSLDRKSTRLNSSHGYISYAVFCLKKKTRQRHHPHLSRSSLLLVLRPLLCTLFSR